MTHLIVLGRGAVIALALTWASAARTQSWEAVNPQVVAGENVRLEVRLVRAEAMAGPISVGTTRLDMAPDGMTSMTAKLTAVAAL